MRSSTLSSVLRSALELQEPVRVSGLPNSACAYTVARYSQLIEKQNVVVICPDQEKASQFQADTQAFLSSMMGKETPVHLFPTWSLPPTVRLLLHSELDLTGLR